MKPVMEIHMQDALAYLGDHALGLRVSVDVIVTASFQKTKTKIDFYRWEYDWGVIVV